MPKKGGGGGKGTWGRIDDPNIELDEINEIRERNEEEIGEEEEEEE